MSDFYDLRLPEHTNGVSPTLWYIEAQHASLFLLRTTGELTGIHDAPLDEFYFASELEAHMAAVQYYLDNGNPHYPHGDEYVAAAGRTAKQNSLPTTVESQVMEFV